LKIGGKGVVFEIDESLFAKVKHHRARTNAFFVLFRQNSTGIIGYNSQARSTWYDDNI
jgi:hypothetical protein